MKQIILKMCLASSLWLDELHGIIISSFHLATWATIYKYMTIE